tara:strand:- start:11736 stop:12113 length:378 start_codon:yes stop_codon:yes gene_type:complete
MKKSLLLIFTTLLLIGCTGNDDDTEVRIRLSNVSQYNFNNITINTSNGNVAFENILSGESSAYKEFGFAYRYAFVELEIDGETFTLQPIDYVGENRLPRGNYTYQINVDDSQGFSGTLSLTLVED